MKKISKKSIMCVACVLLIISMVGCSKKKNKELDLTENTTQESQTTLNIVPDIGDVQEPITEADEAEEKTEMVTLPKPTIKNNTTTTTRKAPTNSTTTTKKQTVNKNTTTTTTKKTVTTTKKNTSNLPKQSDIDLTKLSNGAKYIGNDGEVYIIKIIDGVRYAVDSLGLRTVIRDNHSSVTGDYSHCENCGSADCAARMSDWYCPICKRTITAHECHPGSHGRAWEDAQ